MIEVINITFFDCAKFQAVIHLPVTAETWVLFQSSPRGDFGVHSGTGIIFFFCELFCCLLFFFYQCSVLIFHSFTTDTLIVALDSVVKKTLLSHNTISIISHHYLRCCRINGITLRDYTVHQYYQPLYYPNNALSCIKCTVIKNITNIKTAPTCFGSRRNHPQEANVST